MNDFHLKEKLEDSDVKSLQIRLNTKIEEITGSKDEDEMMAVRTLSFPSLSLQIRKNDDDDVFAKKSITGICYGDGTEFEDDEGCVE